MNDEVVRDFGGKFCAIRSCPPKTHNESLQWLMAIRLWGTRHLWKLSTACRALWENIMWNGLGTTARGHKVEFIMGWIEWQSQPSRKETWFYKIYAFLLHNVAHMCQCVNLSIHLLWTLIIYPPLQLWSSFIQHQVQNLEPGKGCSLFGSSSHWLGNVWVMSIVASGPALNTAMTSFDSL